MGKMRSGVPPTPPPPPARHYEAWVSGTALSRCPRRGAQRCERGTSVPNRLPEQGMRDPGGDFPPELALCRATKKHRGAAKLMCASRRGCIPSRGCWKEEREKKSPAGSNSSWF